MNNNLSEVIGQSMFPEENSYWINQLAQPPPGPPAPSVISTQPPNPPQQPPPHTDSTREPQHPQMDKEVEEYLVREGVTQKNIEILTSNGFTQFKIIKLLSEKDIADIAVEPLGQRKLLQQIVETILPGPSSATTMPPKPPQTMETQQATDSIAAQLETLFRTIPSTSSHNTGAAQDTLTGKHDHNNALFHLLPPSKVKYHQIIKFVHVRGEEEEEEEVYGDGKHRLIVKGGKTSIKLHQVSPMQWSGANVKILMELLRDGSLNPASIPDYLEYTAKICDLAEIYQWVSVLQYDDLYRKTQAENGFRWATESPHVHRVCLRYKDRKPHTNDRKPSRLCINFQYNKCRRGDSCMFRHACSAPGCGKRHALADHDNEKGN